MTLVVCLAGCTVQEDRQQPGHSPGPTEQIPPNYKTKWEQRVERLARASTASGSSLADSYDDYRNTNAAKFFITKPPVTTGFRAPAEYEQSQACLLAWPKTSTSALDQVFAAIVDKLNPVTTLVMVHEDSIHKTLIQQKLATYGVSSTGLTWWQHATNSMWVRNYGPISLVSTPSSGTGELSFVDFRYYHTRPNDDELPTDLAQNWGINVFRPDLDLEPGNLTNTYDGMCALTKATLALNPQLAQSAVETVLQDYLGCKAFVWPAPMSGGAPTHVDMFAKLVDNTTVLVAEYTQAQDATNKAILDANAQLFAQATRPGGGTLAVTRIPMPDKGGSAPNWIWRTYTSAALVNGVALIPVYAQETSKQAQALSIYSQVLPSWTQATIASDALIPLQGAVHSITMQIPLGTKAKMETDPADLCGATKLICATAACGNINSAGCCAGNVLKYCDAGNLVTRDCSGDPQCGWDGTNGWYNCGMSGGADPSGANPISCDVVADAAVPDVGQPDAAVPDIGVPDIGVPDVGIPDVAMPDVVVPDVAVPDVAVPDAAVPVPDTTVPVPDVALPDTSSGGCGSVSYLGCCAGTVLKYCESNQVKTKDCSSSPSCGWDAVYGWYDCGTGGAADPSGQYPKVCAGSVADMGVPAPDISVPDLFTPDTAAPDLLTVDGSTPAPDSSSPDLLAPDTSGPDLATPDSSLAQPDQAVAAGDQGTSVKGDAGGGGGDDDGCSCRTGRAPGRPLPALLLLGLLGLVLHTTRRRRGR